MKMLHHKPALIAATVALLGAGAALQTVASAQTEQLPEVLVEAGPITRTVVGRSAMSNAPIESTTVDYIVRYSDLDLTRHADVLALQQRVEAAARSACGQLDEFLPIEQSYHQSRACIEDAIHGVSQQMQQAIASAPEGANRD